MLSNAIEDWLIEKRKKRDKNRSAENMKLRNEGREYERLVAAHEARGEEPPPPPWESNQN